MKINKLNYEAFMIDYLEGTLSQNDKQAFNAFLSAHPQIKSELTDYLDAPIIEEDLSIIYTAKEKLYQPKSKKSAWWIPALLLLLATAIALVITTTYNANQPANKSKVVPEKTSDYLPIASLEKLPAAIETEESKDAGVVIDNGQSRAIALDRPLMTKSKTTPLATPITAPRERVSYKPETTKQDELINNIPEHSFASVTPQENATTEKVTTKEAQLLQKVEAVAQIPQLKTAALASTEAEGLISETAVMTIILYETTLQKQKKWWAAITPQAYKNVNLRESLSSINLKTAAEGFENMVLPKSIITN